MATRDLRAVMDAGHSDATINGYAFTYEFLGLPWQGPPERDFATGQGTRLKDPFVAHRRLLMGVPYPAI
jgi:hypothetical protein